MHNASQLYIQHNSYTSAKIGSHLNTHHTIGLTDY